jgi:hypothetical protein
MFQKLKITSCAFILFLFAFMLITVSPAFAQSETFISCQQMKWKQGKKAKKIVLEIWRETWKRQEALAAVCWKHQEARATVKGESGSYAHRL